MFNLNGPLEKKSYNKCTSLYVSRIHMCSYLKPFICMGTSCEWVVQYLVSVLDFFKKSKAKLS